MRRTPSRLALLLLASASCTASRGDATEDGGSAGAGGSGAAFAGGQGGSAAVLQAAGAGASLPPPTGSGGADGSAAGASGGGPASGAGGSTGGGGAPSTDAGASGAAGAASAGSGGSAAILPASDGVDQDGPFATSEDLASGPSGDSGLFHPSELGKDGLVHPIFVWGCGGGSQPATYAMHMKRIASHGFVVIAAVSQIGDDDQVLSANLDWLLAENARPDSPLHAKLDPSRIGAGGHSIGSVNAFLFADDPRLRTTVHVAGGSLDDVNDPFAPTTGMGGKSLIHPTALICSESDIFGNVEKTEADYAQASAPVFFTVISGAEHITVTTDALPAIVAWLRWQLGGELERSGAFLDPAGEFRTGRYVSQSKNW